MKQQLPSFEITLPVLNEERRLEQALATIKEFLANSLSSRCAWGLVIADNGSVDGTGALGAALAAADPRVGYVRLEQKGVGRALKKSWSESSADFVGYMDLDLATDLKHLPEAFDALTASGADVAYGSRLHHDSKVVGRSVKREVTSRTFNAILRNYLRTTISDGMCGFKFLRRDIVSRLQAGGAVSDGWFFCTELLVVAERSGFRLAEIPVQWTDSSESRVRIVPLALEYLKAMRVLKARVSSASGR